LKKQNLATKLAGGVAKHSQTEKKPFLERKNRPRKELILAGLPVEKQFSITFFSSP
jgi:hypothetical protein